MTHPIGKHISKEQDHELDYWLKKHDFKESKDNRKSLCSLIVDLPLYFQTSVIT